MDNGWRRYLTLSTGRAMTSPYAAIAEELSAQPVQDVGCETGSQAILLAGTGRAVLAAAFPDVANSKASSTAVLSRRTPHGSRRPALILR